PAPSRRSRSRAPASCARRLRAGRRPARRAVPRVAPASRATPAAPRGRPGCAARATPPGKSPRRPPPLRRPPSRVSLLSLVAPGPLLLVRAGDVEVAADVVEAAAGGGAAEARADLLELRRVEPG